MGNIVHGDSPEMIAACLSCTKKQCKGDCRAVRVVQESAEMETKKKARGGRPRKLWEMDGEALTAYEWGQRYGVPGALVARRLRAGVPIREAVQPSEHAGRRLLTARGRTMSMASWARALGVTIHSLWALLGRRGGDIKQAIDYYEHRYGVRIDAAASGDATEGGDQPGEV